MTYIVLLKSHDLSLITYIISLSHDSLRRLKLTKGNKAEQCRKKIAKLETDLRVLQEGGPLETRYGSYGSGLRGMIEGSIRGMSL